MNSGCPRIQISRANTPCLGVLLLCWFLSTLAATACSVPVFRYALERWPADPYGVVVFHRGELTEAQSLLADQLDPIFLGDNNNANVVLQKINLDEAQGPLLEKFWEEHKSETLPWVVAFYPPQTRIAEPAWAAPLDEASNALLIDSPARREIARRLLKGDSAIWVLLETGDKERDDAAYARLEEQIAVQVKALKLPEIAAKDIEAGLLDAPKESLAIAFSALRVSRKDAAESAFVDMLLGIEEDLHELNEPIVFPVFGRGRALYALVGDGINAENVEEAATFLTGPCSCQVKDQNPGVDLVMSVNWDPLVRSTINLDKELPPLSGFLAPMEEAPDDASSASTEAPPATKLPAAPARPIGGAPQVATSFRPSWIVLGLIGLAVVAGLATVLLFRNR